VLWRDDCPLCGHESHDDVGAAPCDRHPLWRPGLPTQMRWRQCRQCHHVFTGDHFEQHEFDLLFADDAEPPGTPDERRYVWAPTVRNVAAIIPPPARWLDVGCGDGCALFVADEWGYEIAGVDTRAGSVENLTRRGFAGFTDIATAGNDYDIVSMFDVLEHVPDPPAMLDAVRGALTEGGLFVVSCPNMDSEAWRELDAAGRNPYWGEIEHLHNFTRSRLQSLLRDCGFTPISFNIPKRWMLGMEIVARRSS